jgi:hypothetical protein
MAALYMWGKGCGLVIGFLDGVAPRGSVARSATSLRAPRRASSVLALIGLSLLTACGDSEAEQRERSGLELDSTLTSVIVAPTSCPVDDLVAQVHGRDVLNESLLDQVSPVAACSYTAPGTSYGFSEFVSDGETPADIGAALLSDQESAQEFSNVQLRPSPPEFGLGSYQVVTRLDIDTAPLQCTIVVRGDGKVMRISAMVENGEEAETCTKAESFGGLLLDPSP